MNKGRIKGPRQRIFGLNHVWGQTGVWRLLHYPWNPVDPPTPNTPLSTPWWSWRTSGLFLFLFEDQIFIANQGPGRLLKWWMCCFNMKKSEKWASHTSLFWIISCSFSKVSQSNSSGKNPQTQHWLSWSDYLWHHCNLSRLNIKMSDRTGNTAHVDCIQMITDSVVVDPVSSDVPV